ncbi:uncharacterized protein [Ptychodera flava]|uniref:uncharacterized protein n=1 Tax=Ptychodera flava TaxID=63121 RepID=UPI00396A6584
MPNNKVAVEYRLPQLRKKFRNNDDYRQEYTAFMEGIMDKGYAERVPQEELEGNPGKKVVSSHHGVYHPQKQKIWVVFDCGAEYKGTSLNRKLMEGPDLTSSLVGVLIRFREEQIALMSDIEAMFSQVGVSQENRDFQRFLWWPNGSVEEPPVEYRMTVHIFGATSSPSCANFALKKSTDSTSNLSVKNTISRNFYVDDMLKPASTVTEGKTLAEGLIDTCKKSGFKLMKWISNTRPVLEAIPEEQRATEVKNLDLEQDDLPTEHALGMQWNVDLMYLNSEIVLKRNQRPDEEFWECENPADECSRGQKIDVFLKNERWRGGPDFLLKTQDKWPSDSYSTQLDPEDAEVKKSALVHRVSVRSEEETVPVVFGTVPVVSEERQTSGRVTVSTTSVNAEETVQKLIHYYSSWYKLKKAVAWIRKVGDTLLRRAKNKSCSVDGPHEITVEDMKAAETAIIKFVQKKAFPKDVESLSADRYTDKKSQRNSNIYRLDPVMGADGLLRVGGRLSLSTVAEEAKHPVILPKCSHVAELLLREIYE